MESENRHEFDVTLATFHHPRYEIVPTGDVFDGEEEVRAYFAETRRAFPDQRNRLVRLQDRKSTRLNSSHTVISYAVFCLKKKKKQETTEPTHTTDTT